MRGKCPQGNCQREMSEMPMIYLNVALLAKSFLSCSFVSLYFFTEKSSKKVSTKNFHSRLFHSQIFHEPRTKTIHGKACTVLRVSWQSNFEDFDASWNDSSLRLDLRDHRQAWGLGNFLERWGCAELCFALITCGTLRMQAWRNLASVGCNSATILPCLFWSAVLCGDGLHCSTGECGGWVMSFSFPFSIC